MISMAETRLISTTMTVMIEFAVLMSMYTMPTKTAMTLMAKTTTRQRALPSAAGSITLTRALANWQ